MNRPPSPTPPVEPVVPEQGTRTGSGAGSVTPTQTTTLTSQTQTGTVTTTQSQSQSQSQSTPTRTQTATSTTRAPLPPGADQNTPIRVCDQYPLSSIDSLRPYWSQNLVRALERNLTNAAPIFPDPQLVALVRTAIDSANSNNNASDSSNSNLPDLSLARARADTQIAAALMPYWGSRHVAGCFRFARFHSDLFFCTDGSVAARSCLVNDKCPALGQPLVALAPNRDPETVPGVELRDVPLNILIPSPTLKINNGNTSILIPPPENAAAALIYGCWDVPKAPGTGNTDPSARVYVCQVERPQVSTPENDPAPWIRQAAPRLLCPVPFMGALPPTVSPTTPIIQPGIGSNNGMGDNGNNGTMLAVPAIIAIVVGSSILAAALVALGLFVRSRFRSRRRNHRHHLHPSSAHSASHRDGRRSLFAPPTLSTISTTSHHLAPGTHRRGSDDATPRSSFMLMHVGASNNTAPIPASLPDADRIVTTVRWENTVVAGHDARLLLASCTPAPSLPNDTDMRHPDGTPMTPTSPTAPVSVLPYDVAAIRAEWDALFADVSRLIKDRIAALDEQHFAKLAVYQTVASQSLGYSAASMDRRTSFAAGDRRSLSAASFSGLHAPRSPAPSALSLQRATTTSPRLGSITESTASLAGSPSSPTASPPLPSSLDHTTTTAHLSALLFQLANVIFAHFLPAHLLSPDKRTTYGTVVATYHPAYAHVARPRAQPLVQKPHSAVWPI
ncbi:hypothetical protein BCR44DRAFT_1274645 [Catenaria anguillulae PL171]|uniref:Uncharacterized protein n=1 Tax=Catenaria anguillulae PL171 TaxID=765915 RepID=A0A1Y2HBE6_9FUNG|nr:hypothetical protein BCR44DRAFT_1274645 [Catenaria anguillulae PL171]